MMYRHEERVVRLNQWKVVYTHKLRTPCTRGKPDGASCLLCLGSLPAIYHLKVNIGIFFDELRIANLKKPIDAGNLAPFNGVPIIYPALILIE